MRLAPGTRADRDAERRFIEAAERACLREIDLVVESPGTSVILRRQVASHGRELFERTPGPRAPFAWTARTLTWTCFRSST